MLDFARAVFHKRLGLLGACLETLVEAAGDGLWNGAWNGTWAYWKSKYQEVTNDK